MPHRASNYGVGPLTPTEQLVVDMLCEGLPPKKIATKLNRSLHTVHEHLHCVFLKLDVHSQVAVVAKVLNDRIDRLETALAAQ